MNRERLMMNEIGKNKRERTKCSRSAVTVAVYVTAADEEEEAERVIGESVGGPQQR